VKKSESKQFSVRDRYEKLAPIVIQGSYHLPKLERPAERAKQINRLCQATFFSESSYFIVTAFESGNEIAMKNYLLKPHRRAELCKGNVWLVRAEGLRDCWRFIKDKYFFCVHFQYDPTTLLKNIEPSDLQDSAKVLKFIEESDICLGILSKRGNASIKSMLKVYRLDSGHTSESQMATASTEEKKSDSQEVPFPKAKFNIPQALGCPGSQISGINTMALMLRMELYVDEARWRSDEEQKEIQVALNTLIQTCEELIGPTLIHWNKSRTEVIQGLHTPPQDIIYKLKPTTPV
jgi:hypothetical protein